MGGAESDPQSAIAREGDVNAWLYPVTLVVCLSPVPRRPDSVDRVPVAETAVLTSITQRSIDELKQPCPFRLHINESYPSGDERSRYGWVSYRPHDLYDDCAEAMDRLVKTTEPVEGRLLELARDESLPARYRAVWVLTQRRNAATVPLLLRMATARSVEERYLGWHTYSEAIRARKLPVPQRFDLAIERYGKEEVHEVRWSIAVFLGASKAKAAVPVLSATLRANPADCHLATVLAEIGDPTAVPVIVKALKSERNGYDIYLQALGRLGTPEAVDCLIEHLDEYGAVEGLFESRSPRALPALRKHLRKLESSNRRDDIDLSTTRVCILRLSEPDPREALLRWGEDRKELHDVRVHALWALCDYDASPLAARILRLYETDRDNSIRLFCIRLLQDKPGEAITRAMVRHALVEGRDEWECADDLVQALSHRLDKRFRNLEELRRYLREQQKARKAGTP
jgi:HEAT repeat protein